MITENYVSFETAKLLKEKGFDAECDYLYVDGELVRAQGCACNWNGGETLFANYKNECSAPTLQMAMKWLREKYKLNVEVCLNAQGYEGIITTVFNGAIKITNTIPVSKHNIYEEACEAAIKYCLENLI